MLKRILLLAPGIIMATLGLASPLTNCACTNDQLELWVMPSNTTGASPLAIGTSDGTSCWNLNKSAGCTLCDGACVFLGPCNDPGTPTWQWAANGTRLEVVSPSTFAGWCLDENTAGRYLQAYPNCIEGDTHQLWAADAYPVGRIHELWTGTFSCVAPEGNATECPEPPPPPPGEFCYFYHALTGANYYDPSGPLLGPDGTWHLWEDAGGWGYFTSTDLLHWNVGGPSTGFGGLTGSVAVTPAGAFAFYPEGSQVRYCTHAPHSHTRAHAHAPHRMIFRQFRPASTWRYRSEARPT